MSKYFDTKPGSLEEAVSAAQQAAIAISKKERGEKPKNEKDEDASQFAFVAQKAKEKGDKTFMFGGKKYDTETEEVIKEAKKILDLENDDPKLIKDIKKFGLKVKDLGDSGNAGYNEFEISGPQSKIDAAIKKLQLETNKNNKSDDGEGLDAVQPNAVKKKFKDRKDKDIDNDGDVDSTDKYLHKRRKAISKSMGESIMSVAESVKAMWDEAAKKTESQDMENDKDGDGMDDDQKAKKTKMKTDTGKNMTPVDVSPKMPKVKNEKNKV
jgi:hypothetical protein